MHVYTYVFREFFLSPVTIWWLFLNLSALSPGSQVLSNQYTETDENIEMICKKKDMKHEILLGFWKKIMGPTKAFEWTWKRKKSFPPFFNGRNSLRETSLGGTYPSVLRVPWSGKAPWMERQWFGQVAASDLSSNVQCLGQNSPKLKACSTWMSCWKLGWING